MHGFSEAQFKTLGGIFMSQEERGDRTISKSKVYFA